MEYFFILKKFLFGITSLWIEISEYYKFERYFPTVERSLETQKLTRN